MKDDLFTSGMGGVKGLRDCLAGKSLKKEKIKEPVWAVSGWVNVFFHNSRIF